MVKKLLHLLKKYMLKGINVENILARGVLQAFLIQGVGAVMLLIMEIYAARILGIHQFGVYSTAMTWIYILSLVGTLGLNHALLRFVPTYLAHEDWGSLRGLLRRSNLWAGAASMLFVLSGALLIFAFETVWHGMVFTAILALLAIPFQVLSSLRQATLRGLGKISYALMPEFILRPVVFISLFFGATILIKPINATHALAMNLVAAIIAFIIGAIWQRRFLPPTIQKHAPVYHDQQWILIAMPLLLIVGFNLISSRIGVVMLGMLSEHQYVGMYAAASKVADAVVFGLVSANAVVAPMIARLHSTGRHDELQRVVLIASKGIALFTIPAALLLIIFGREILCIFGPDFSEGYSVLVILVCGQIVNALTGPVGYLMTMTGHQNKAAKFVASAAVLNLLLSVVLIPIAGMVGAAIATTISIIFWNILMLRFVKLELSISCSIFNNKIKPVKIEN